MRDQVRPSARKLLVLFEWRREALVGGADRGGRGEPERSSVLGEKRDACEVDVRIMDGRVCLRDLPRPRAFVCARGGIERGKLGGFFGKWWGRKITNESSKRVRSHDVFDVGWTVKGEAGRERQGVCVDSGGGSCGGGSWRESISVG